MARVYIESGIWEKLDRERIRHYNGKVYKMEGPYYAPHGITWVDLENYIQTLRDKGWLIRVEKVKIPPGTTVLSPNTHRVFLYKRKGK